MDESTSNPQNVNEDKRPIIPANRAASATIPKLSSLFRCPIVHPWCALLMARRRRCLLSFGSVEMAISFCQ